MNNFALLNSNEIKLYLFITFTTYFLTEALIYPKNNKKNTKTKKTCSKYEMPGQLISIEKFFYLKKLFYWTD